VLDVGGGRNSDSSWDTYPLLDLPMLSFSELVGKNYLNRGGGPFGWRKKGRKGGRGSPLLVKVGLGEVPPKNRREVRKCGGRIPDTGIGVGTSELLGKIQGGKDT